MKIQKMFVDDINRKINGVIQVTQMDESTEREINEYVITHELQRHFDYFFDYYERSFNELTDNIGVWISGFFGSGKSHFLKMLSYLLENKNINGVKTVERFRKKFDDDSATYKKIQKATVGETETILFNIDAEGSIDKDKTAVLRVFAKMFYNHLGFYGEDLKVAKLEQYIAKRDKTKQFHKVFEESYGESWLEARKNFAFIEDFVVPALIDVLNMKEQAAYNWFNGTETIAMSITKLVSEIKEYVDTKPDNFRLLFMADEVGQYIGADTDLLLNLQSLVEKIGSECRGKVWVVCTGQEAIDEIIKTRQDEFSRIQARFQTRLSLSSSSVDEVIQKRILKKTPEATTKLKQIYSHNLSILRNLFTFTQAVGDIRGYSNGIEFVDTFPFVHYQFILMPKVYFEIRTHGNSGKHLSGGERSMLSAFQEVAQDIQDKNEFAIAPFYLFYDTVHNTLDSSIRRVIERSQKAANNHQVLEQQDINVLKLLYLIRYIRDIQANLDNILIMMADDIRIDKISKRQSIQASLDRLISQNYIDKHGDSYTFLTDDEQDIAREIAHTSVDSPTIVKRIGEIIFGDIYKSKKYAYGDYNFSFTQMVDNQNVSSSGDLGLRFITIAHEIDKTKLRSMPDTKGIVIVVLAENNYYEILEKAMKIRKYVKQKNISQLNHAIQNIIRTQQDNAMEYEKLARTKLEEAITEASFYVDGDMIKIKREIPVSRMIDQALGFLVKRVYCELKLITRNFNSIEDIRTILYADKNQLSEIMDNQEAIEKITDYLEIRYNKNLATTMLDIQNQFQAKPFGWREIDIAGNVAILLVQQKVTIKYGGNDISAKDLKVIDMLRKKSEIGKTLISKKISVSAQNIRKIRELLKEYFDIMSVPKEEQDLISFIITKFSEQHNHYLELLNKYHDNNSQINNNKYPDYTLLRNAINLITDILSQQKNNIALINYILKMEDNLLDNKDDLLNLESFFKNQVSLFDSAKELEQNLQQDLPYLKNNANATNALNTIRLITLINIKDSQVYRRIPELNNLMNIVRTEHDKLLKEKRAELLEVIRQCVQEIRSFIDRKGYNQVIYNNAETYFEQQKNLINEISYISLLEARLQQICHEKDNFIEQLEASIKPTTLIFSATTVEKRNIAKKNIKTIYRQIVFPSKTLESKGDIDAYVEQVRTSLYKALENFDGIKLN